MTETIVTHPDNYAWLKQHLEEVEPPRHAWGMVAFPLFEIRTNDLMDRDKPTGRYILPGGRVVDRDRVRVGEGRFVEYGPEDIGYLLLAGIIQEERERLFYRMRTPRFHFDFTLPWVTEPRAMLKHFS